MSEQSVREPPMKSDATYHVVTASIGLAAIAAMLAIWLHQGGML